MSVNGIFGWLLTTSWQVALLVVLILVLQRLLGRWLTPRWRYALWLLVLARLFLPVQPEMARGAVDWDRVSLQEWPSDAQRGSRPDAGGSEARSSVEPTEESPRVEPTEDTPREEFDEASTQAVTARVEEVAAPRSSGGQRPISLLGASSGASPPMEEPRSAEELSTPWPLALLVAWLGTALLLIARDLLRERAFRRSLRRAAPVSDPAVVELFESCRLAARFPRRVDLVQTDLVGSPAAAGWLRPRILLPSAILADFRPEELRHVFLHELAHLRRGDVPLNALLVLAQRLYWFHPLVRLALGRLRAAQESTRDWEALALARDADPVPYARTLLRLIEEGSQRRAPSVGFLQAGNAMKWRILMITRFRPASLRGAVLGLGLLGVLGWTAFTTAAAAPVAKVGADPSSEVPVVASDGFQVRVERQQAPEPWRAELRERLNAPQQVAFRDTPLEAVLEWIRTVANVNVVVDMDDGDLDDLRLTLQGEFLTSEQVLNIVTRTHGELSWCLAREAVCLGWRGNLPLAMDLRFYNVGPLLPYDEDVDDYDGVDDVLTLAQEMTWMLGDWESDGVRIDFWRGLVVVKHTDEMHAAVEASLNRMLNRGEAAPEPTPEWKHKIQGALDRVLNVKYEDEDFADVVHSVGEVLGVPIVLPADYDDSLTVSLNLQGVTATHVLEWLATIGEFSVFLDDGAVVFGRGLPVEFEFFEVADLIHSRPDAEDWDAADGLDSMIRDHVDPESWDERPEVMLRYWKDMMVVAQTRPALDAIQDLLDAARRASDE